VIKENWRSLVIIVTSVLLLIFLYAQSTKADLAQLYQVEALTHDVMAQESILAGEMGQLLHGRLNHYDSLTQDTLHLLNLQQRLNETLQSVAHLRPYLETLNQRIDVQLEPIETFKTKLALYRNSTRYLPTLIRQTLASSAQNIELVSKVRYAVYTLLSQPAEFDSAAFKHYLAGIKEPSAMPLVHHVQGLFKNYDFIISAMSEFMGSGAGEAAKTLANEYQVWFQAKQKEAEFYEFLLIIFSALLIVYIAVMLWHLKKSAQTLRETNRFLHYLQKGLDEHAIVTITDKSGDIVYANNKFSQISGYSQEEVLGKNHRMLKSSEHSKAFFDKLWLQISKGETWRGVIKNIKKDGGYYWVNSTILPFLNEKGEIWQYVSVRTDVTKQIAMEKKLKESRSRYKALTNMIPYALAVIQDNQWVYANNTAVKMFAASSVKDLLHQPIQTYIGDEELLQLQQAVEQKISLPMQECKLQTMQGKTFDAEFQAAYMMWEGKPALLLAMYDISVRKQEEAEREEYQTQLEHTQRLESLGVLAGGIAHDFNNILTAIMGNTALATTHIEQPELLVQDLDKVSKASMRAAELCEQMLMYSGGGVFEKKPVLLTDLLSDVSNMVRTTLRDQIHLRVIVAPHLQAVEADIRQMQQVILNLLTNAAEAIETSGTITADLNMVDIDDTSTFVWVNDQHLAHGQYVSLAVTDTGCGMDAETLDKMFEPFFTTKFTGRGLGMSAMIGIVQAHQGGIAIESKFGQGTTIRVFLPASSVEVVEEEKERDSVMHGGKVNGKILVIDDEPDIVEFVVAVLQDVGFDVISAADGDDGIAKYETHKHDLSLVICDMVMPKLGGMEVAEYIHQNTPNIPVLLSSGYDEDALVKTSDGMIAGFIHKPYLPATLIKRVFKALNIAE